MTGLLNSTFMHYGLPVAVAMLFAGILFTGSRISGWHRLAEHYVIQGRHEGWTSDPNRDLGDVFVELNHSESEGAIQLGADRRGLYLSMSLWFRLFHPPLFMPWHEVGSEWIQGVPWSKKKNTLRITFAAVPDVPLDVHRDIAIEIQARAEGRWKIPNGD